MIRSERSPAAVALITVALLAAAPPVSHFAPAAQSRLANGARLVSQPIAQTPLIAAQLFVPGGVAQQAPDRAGIAAIAADMVLHTPGSGGRSVLDVAASVGGQISYTLDPNDTLYTIDCRASDFPAIFKALVAALLHPDPSQFAAAQQRALSAADDSVKNPVATLLGMVRQVNYANTGLEYLDMGKATTITQVGAAQAVSFVRDHIIGGGTVLALSGLVDAPASQAAETQLALIPSGLPGRLPTARRVTRQHQVVVHRNVHAPWVGVGYQAPSQYSRDFSAMLVVSALLGQGGDAGALSFGSLAPLPEDFVGAYYQYEAQPGSLIIFLNGAEGSNIDQSIQELQLAIARLRAQSLPASLVDHGRRLAIGQYYMSVTTLVELAGLEGRAAMSPQGLSYADAVPRAIARVSAADIRRVAQTYLKHETVGIVLPQSSR